MSTQFFTSQPSPRPLLLLLVQTFLLDCVSHFVELFSVLIRLTSLVFLNVPDVSAVMVITVCGALMGESAHVTGELLKAAVGVVLWIMSVVSV